MTLFSNLLRKECPTCHKMMPRADLQRHIKRHEAGRASWETRNNRLAFTTRPVPDALRPGEQLSLTASQWFLNQQKNGLPDSETP
jgi:hypothetical protein